MSGAFEAAVQYAREKLSPMMNGRLLTAHVVEPYEAQYRFSLRITEEFPDDFPAYIFRPGTMEYLALKALRDRERGAYDLLINILASRLCRKEPIPKRLRQFMANCLTERIVPPKRTKLAKTFGENLVLLDLLHQVRHFAEIPLTRNEASPPVSACDAVSMALSQFGYAKSERALRDLTVHRTHFEVRRVYAEARKAALSAPEDEPALAAILADLAEASTRDGEE